jgi:hypothetical protein
MMYDKILEDVTVATDRLQKSVLAKSGELEAQRELVEKSKTPLCDWLDSMFGKTIFDIKIFENLTRYWENEFNSDMEALNVLHR